MMPCTHCGGDRTLPDGDALRLGFSPCPFCSPPLPAGLDTLDFVQAEREADACGHPQHYRIWQERFSAELQRQCAALIAQAREEEREKMAETVASAYHEGREQKDRQYAPLVALWREWQEARKVCENQVGDIVAIHTALVRRDRAFAALAAFDLGKEGA